MNWLWLVPAGGYVLGSFLPGRVLVRRRTGRPPAEADDNPGAAGSWRLAGPAVGLTVLIADLVKGALPLAVLDSLGGAGVVVATAAAAAPVAGHCWPLWSPARGGRGLAAMIGAGTYLLPLIIAPYVLFGGLVAWWRGRTPWVGYVGLPLALFFMVWLEAPPGRLWPVLAAMVVVAVRNTDRVGRAVATRGGTV